MTGISARCRLVRATSEAGSALAIALVFLMLFGVLVGVVLDFATTGQRTTGVVRDEATGTYAGGGAVDAAINAIRGTLADGTEAAGTSTCFTLPAGALDNPTSVDVTCRPRTGSGASGGGSSTNQPTNAVLALSGTATEGVSLAGSANVPVQGPVAVANRLLVPAGTTLTSSGTVKAGSCSVAGTVTPTCTTPATAADPGWAGPDGSAIPLTGTLPPCTSLVTLSPGIYRSASALQAVLSCPNSVVWLRPGTYVLDFRDSGTHELVTSAADVIVGGTPAGWTPAVTAASGTPKATIPYPTPGSPSVSACDLSAAGVDLVFAADSRLTVPSGKVQLCALSTSVSAQHVVARGLAAAGSVASTGTSTTSASSDLNVSTRKWDTPTQGAVVDGVTAHVKVPNVAGTAPRLLVGPVSSTTVPADATAITVTASVTESLDGTGNTSLAVRPGDGSATLAPALLRDCPVATPCGPGMRTDVAAITGLTAAQVNGLSFELVVTNPNNSPIDAWVDGITVSVAFSLPIRPSCQLSSPTGSCVAGSVPPAPVLSAAGTYPSTVLALHGTVYAPRAAVDLSVLLSPHVVVDRGLAVRHLTLGLTPAAGYSGPLISVPTLGQAPRRLLVTASDGSGAVLARADVTLSDSSGTSNGTVVRVNEWSVR